MDRCRENVIEWIEGDKIAKCTFSQKKFINRIRRMSATHGSCVKILAENMDGSILASVPLSAVHITIYTPKKGELKGGRDEENN